ncbi:uncharacterized protein A1O5_12031 [Cladophialophora psammophila CBS 110553]|uniref:Uncharacterized protein n=1 Tax=Cladophialophora psammophila CBS 110553 TaxID=1182543 RepID=W9WSB0_9EURO|nr:uncharacterized protein A1O5_12031 [Cladophialophora psammophila CBS 110553]EXJ61239.1 hypothetical protein A1O5_12031 [Cladophialophora psammophila CBS 110553]
MLQCSFLSDLYDRGLLPSRSAIDFRQNHVTIVPASSIIDIDPRVWRNGGFADTGFQHFDRPVELAGNGPVSIRLATFNDLFFLAIEYANTDESYRGINPLQDMSIINRYGPVSVVKLLKQMWEIYDSLGLLLLKYTAETPPEKMDLSSQQLGAVHGALATAMMNTASECLNRRIMEVAKGDEYAQDPNIEDMFEVIGLHHKAEVFLKALRGEAEIENKVRIWQSYRDDVSFLRAKVEKCLYFMKSNVDVVDLDLD